MTWTAPVFCSLNAAVDDASVAANPWTADEAMLTGYPLTNLHDGRIQTQARWSTSATTHYLDFDRGAAGTWSVNRMIIANHNLATKYVKLDSGTTHPPATARVATTLVLSGSENLTSFDFTSTTDRYFRLSFPTAAVTPQIGMVMFTRYDALTRGPVQGWDESIVTNNVVYPSGAAVQLQVPRRKFDVEFRKVGSSDIIILRRCVSGLDQTIISAYPYTGSRPIAVYMPYHTTSVSGPATRARMMNLIEYQETADVEVPNDNDYLAHVRMSFLEQLA